MVSNYHQIVSFKFKHAVNFSIQFLLNSYSLKILNYCSNSLEIPFQILSETQTYFVTAINVNNAMSHFKRVQILKNKKNFFLMHIEKD